jgi:hypothetical protein
VSAQTHAEAVHALKADMTAIKAEADEVQAHNLRLKARSRMPDWVMLAVGRVEAAANDALEQLIILAGPPKPQPPPVTGGSPPGCTDTDPVGASTFTCGAGTSRAQVQAKYDIADDNAVFTFEAGVYDWSAFGYIYLNETTAATFKCAVEAACIVDAGYGIAFFGQVFTADNSRLYRISGFDFTTTIVSQPVIVFEQSPSGSVVHLSNVRIDNNIFRTISGGQTIRLGGGGLRVSALIDHNYLISAGHAQLLDAIGPVTDTITGTRGTANNIFVEDNEIINTLPTEMALGCTDAVGSASIVFRYNRTRNCFVSAHGTSHAGGPINWEYYGNTLAVDEVGHAGEAIGDGERLIQHQGSNEVTMFGNGATSASRTGTAQGGTIDTIILDAAASSTDNFYHNLIVDILSGTGAGQSRTTFGYTASTKTTEVTVDWVTPPDSTSVFRLTWPLSVNAFTVSHYRSLTVCAECANVCDGAQGIDGNRAAYAADPNQAGYPCWRQPGRDAADVLKPMYGWNNFWTYNGELRKLRKIATKAHVLANRDYFNAISVQTNATTPWDGSISGLSQDSPANLGGGFGPIAYRPTACYAEPDALDAGNGGVFYFATDEGSWNTESAGDHATHGTDHAQGEDGRLYRCSATNTWTLDYTPYTYPHPGVVP